ncbi:amidohydrolase 3 [Sporormia fimetaria CBS 119925]|uniref:Amidohydrolase 3 n=1 Tax=Sporormia fimetaria CBS 119925 TaxID=1340428 RepID=A0A6A6VFH6_9PLEO|nr:amidohydrolase 3 [Sporormia fimetaria CBS 119925]
MATSISSLVWASIPLLLAALLYQIGLPTSLTALAAATLPQALVGNIFTQTHCYAGVKTLDSLTPEAECLSVKNGVFTKVFKKSDDDSDDGKETTGYVIPGLWDGHGHLSQFGELLHSVDLFGAEDMGDVTGKLKRYKEKVKEAGSAEFWLRGVGWDQAKYGRWPVAEDLEFEDFRDQYVMLDRIDVHCIWVSEKVLSLLPTPLPDIAGGEIPARGVFCDNAMEIVWEHYPKPSKERKTRWIKSAMVELNKLGIVGMHDAGTTPSEIDLYEELHEDDDWTVRVNAMIECDTRNTFCPSEARKLSTPNGKLHVHSVKLFGDGALGSWGSGMIEPYSDKPESSGSLLVNGSTLTQLTKDWSAAGFQVNIHAIGDLANRQAIDAFAAAFEQLCPELHAHECQAKNRFRIEHAQIIHPDDQTRMFEMAIIPSIQPTHATSDAWYVESRLGKTRTEKEAYRMRSLLPLKPVLGSDFPVEPADIFQGMYAAMTRRSPKTGFDKDWSKKGWYVDETLTLEQALRGFTVNPAYAAFLEERAGVIKEGAYADWVVLDRPLEKLVVEGLGVEDLRMVAVKETWVGGKRVYKREE